MKALLKVILGLVVVSIPLLAVWLSSSLAVYLNAPVWVAILTAVVLFPVLPLLWEWWSSRSFEKKQKSGETRKKWLTFSDRFIIRTFVLNLGFLLLLLGLYPKDAFDAVNTRGDWVLANNTGGHYDSSRKLIFSAAEGLEWFHDFARQNPYEEYATNGDSKVKPKPNQIPIPSVGEIAKGTRKRGTPPMWPMKAERHPLVASITSSDETSIKAVAEYIAAREKDPFLRVKALHDYVADRIAYDAVALAKGSPFPPQNADTVFKTRKAVCAGYARLMVVLGKYSGDDIQFVLGESRNRQGQVGSGGHAWNAVKIEGAWYLLDATWNAGYVKGSKFTKAYKTTYLFTPPEVFLTNHFPKHPQWQLLDNPIGRGDFVRQPLLAGGFYKAGLKLVSPTRSQVTVSSDEFVVKLKNPMRKKLSGRIFPKGGGSEVLCEIESGRTTKLICPISSSGIYTMQIWVHAERSRTPVGRLEVVR